jgi:hypothetical protein
VAVYELPNKRGESVFGERQTVWTNPDLTIVRGRGRDRFSWMNESTEASIPRESRFGKFWQRYVAMPVERFARWALVSGESREGVTV